MKYQILNGDNRHVLKTIESNSIDSIVTDPPYGIDFLGKDWDANTGVLETYQECLRVLKPGGHILAFSAARTYHHLAVTLEQAGFEIRDQIMWIYSSGFPKSQDVGKSIQRSLGVKETITLEEYEQDKAYSSNMTKGKSIHGSSKDPSNDSGYSEKITVCSDPEAKQWEGWGTSLKPAHEPICLARKPSKLSIAKNVQRWGTGALNIDATRVPYLDVKDMESAGLNWNKTGYETGGPRFIGSGEENKKVDKPAEKKDNINEQGRFPSNVIGEIADGYQKYFYCPKVSRAERHIGHEMPPAMFGNVQGCYDPETGERFAVGFDNRANIATEDKKGNGIDRVCETCGVSILKPQDCHCPTKSWVRPIKSGNNHPTVKPVELMKYLIKLVTPSNGKVLDPFNGSGSTGMAAVELGYEYIGIEQDDSYCEISRKRIAAHFKKSDPLRASGLFDEC